MGAGICGLQNGGEPVLHEHVHQHHIAGAHQLGQILEVTGERQSTQRLEPDAVGAQSALELLGVRGSVGFVSGGAGAHDRHGGGQRGRWQMLPVQAA